MGIWEEIKSTAKLYQKNEPIMRDHLQKIVLSRSSFADSLAVVLVDVIKPDPKMEAEITKIMKDFFTKKSVYTLIESDLQAFKKRDPACRNLLSVILFYKGFQATAIHRVAHELWQKKQIMLPLYLQGICCRVFAIDIHPAAKIGKSFFMDHGNSIVIGETCVIGEEVSILQDVTLGGTGKEQGDRHPKIGRGVLIGAGAKILGNIKVGDYSKVGASSVVLQDIPPRSVAVGIPATVVGKTKTKDSAKVMDHSLDC